MEQKVQQNKTFKRQDRSVSPETAQKISQSLKSYNATHPRSAEWCKHISDGLRADTGGYWSHIAPAPKAEDGKIGFDDIIL